MDIIIIVLSLLLMILGIVGSFLPILPGPLTSWAGLLVLSFAKTIEVSQNTLILTFIIALTIFVLDYIIPALGTKKYGGSKFGMIGTTIGLIFGLFSSIPFGIILGPFTGALIGEMLYQNDSRHALKAAYGSLIGFLASTFIKFSVAVVYFGLFLWIVF
ncbi:MAG: DUF456 domain-containing protein [Bacteroidota bacterium]